MEPFCGWPSQSANCCSYMSERMHQPPSGAKWKLQHQITCFLGLFVHFTFSKTACARLWRCPLLSSTPYFPPVTSTCYRRCLETIIFPFFFYVHMASPLYIFHFQKLYHYHSQPSKRTPSALLFIIVCIIQHSASTVQHVNADRL